VTGDEILALIILAIVGWAGAILVKRIWWDNRK
jgi:hypothetical protein